MYDRRPNENVQQYAIRRAWELGHFWNPNTPDGWNVKQADLPRLSITDQVVIDAFRSLALSDVTNYARHVFAMHDRPPEFDGHFGPALEAMVLDPAGRCPVPDHAPPPGVVFAFDDPNLQEVVTQMQARAVAPALGVGNWKSCHRIGNAHCASVQVNPANLPAFLQPVFKKVLTRVQAAYAGVGLLFRFLDMNKVDLLTGEQWDSNINIDMSFVKSSDGWIGLAIVGTAEQCAGRIWCRFLATYRGGSNEDAIVTQWTTLLKHELGHNTGRSHTNGGVMNPSIVNGLPAEWTDSDPSTAWLRKQFGGVPVAIPGGPVPGPVPPSAPVPPADSIQAQLDAIRLENLIQRIQIDHILSRLRDRNEASDGQRQFV